MPSPSITVVAHCWLAAVVFLTVRTAAGYVHRITAGPARAAERLRTLREVGYVAATLVTLALAVTVETVPLAAAAIRRGAPALPAELVGVLAAVTLLLGPVLAGVLAVRLGTLRYRRASRRLDLTYRDVTGWFTSRYAATVLALAAATAVVTAAESTVGRLAVAVVLGGLGTVLAPYAISFTVRDRPATEREREIAGVPADCRLRVVDDRTRFGVALAAGVLPGQRYVFVAESLFSGLDERELAAVVAHEVGHHEGGHVPRRFGAVLAAVAPLLVALELGGTTALFAGVGLAAAGAVGAFAVVRRTEYAADAYAARQGLGPALASALEELAVQRVLLTTPGPHAGPFAAHPPLHARVARLEAETARERPATTA
ncbi:M48 family metallopeptidase [Halorientalis pallida]|uniref:M48 family metallopeptidase n=1 Tax=Halorientalis pallida TaxID=2479928 RepID=UPI003C6F4EAE